LSVSQAQVHGNAGEGGGATLVHRFAIAIDGSPSLTAPTVMLSTPEPPSELVPLNGGRSMRPANGPAGVGSIEPFGAVVSTMITCSVAGPAPSGSGELTKPTLSTLSATAMR
jgi:hypothetical protein